MSLALELSIILALICVNAIFAGAEIALLAVRKSRLRELVQAGNSAAKAVQDLRQRPERLLATIQIGITLVGASAAALGGATVERRVEDGLRELGFGGAAPAVGLTIVIIVVSYLTIVLGELVPKSLALRAAEAYALRVGRPLKGLAVLMRPLVWFLTGSSNAVLRVFGDRTSFSEARLSPDELQQLVEESARTGALDPRIGEIASRCFDFAELTVGAVMLPRHKIVALRRHTPGDEVLAFVTEEGHSRFPVYEESLDHIVGYIIARDVLALASEPQLLVLEDLLRPAHVVAESAPAVDVLKELQRRRLQIAIVHDEHGSVAGLVTIEDLVEELVGDIFAEHEVPEVLIQRDAQGRALVQGATPIREVNRELGLDLPEGDGWSTIAGLCTHLAGWIPATGVKLTTDDGTLLEIVDASPSRVRAVRITRAATDTGAETDTDT